MPKRKTLNEDLFYRGSSANLPRLHTCENKVPFWDFSQFLVTLQTNPFSANMYLIYRYKEDLALNNLQVFACLGFMAYQSMLVI